MARLGDTYGGQSNFYKGKEAVTDQPVLTIKGIRTHDFDDGSTQRVLAFMEDEREFGLNKTNWINVAYHVRGEDPEDSDDEQWMGTRIQLYWDPTVTFSGKVCGGIRIKKPAESAPASQPAVWGEDNANKFRGMLIEKVPNTTIKNVSTRIEKVRQHIDPLMPADCAHWPTTIKEKVGAAVVAVIDDIASEEDAGDVPF